MRTLFTTGVFCLLFSIIHGQTLHHAISSPYIGLGAYSRHHADVFSFTSNQASLAHLQNPVIGVISERRFMLNELSLHNAAIAIPTRSGNYGLQASYFGHSEYNETQLGLAYGRKLGDKASIGAQFNYHNIKMVGYGNATVVSAELGVVLKLTDKLNSGFHINNPVGGRFSTNNEEKLPSVYTLGLGYDASEKVFFGIEIVKEETKPVNVLAGIQYKPIEQLISRIGISSATHSLWGGVGLVLRSFRVDATVSYHSQLGFTPGVLLLYTLKKKKND